MPDDAALAPVDALLRSLDTEVLVGPTGLLNARVEDDEVMHDLQQPVLGCQLHEGWSSRPSIREFRIDCAWPGRCP